ncbi:MAG: endonuclease [Candidatus Aenigmatarchaeota archaeon]
MSKILKIYKKLYNKFGQQKWWPISGKFRPKEFEICVGAILTQNTNWKNVEKALNNLIKRKLIDAESISRTDIKKLQSMIRPSGFYKQKAKKLKAFAKFVYEYKGNFYKNITKEELLNINGIGHETADSILLYACNKPYFVVDAYTKRIFSRLGMIDEKHKYEDIKFFFEDNIKKDIKIYKEFHALIVELAKKYCKKIPECKKCPIKDECKYKKEI